MKRLCTLTALTSLAAVSPSLAEIQRFVVGNAQRPWAQAGEMEAVDLEARPGWLAPVWITRDVNILHQLFLDGMLYTGEKPRAEGFRLGVDGRIWTVNGTGAATGDGDNANLILLADGRTEDDEAFLHFLGGASSKAGVSIIIDLGAPFPVDEIRFHPRLRDPHDDDFVRGYQLFANDGDPEAVDVLGKPDLKSPAFLLTQEATNVNPLVQNSSFPPQYIRYIRFRNTAPEPFEMDQFEIRGEGSVKQAAFTSEVIDMHELEGDIANFGRLFWAADTDPGAEAVVRTRFARTLEDTAGWEWSDPYGESGQDLVAPGPARFFQFRIDLGTDLIASQARIDSIALEYSSPTPARQVLAAISPDTVDVGRRSEFTYRIEPRIDPDDTGFDTVELDMPSPATVRWVRVGGRLLGGESYGTTIEKNLLEVRLLDENDRVASDEDVVELGFETTMLVYGTVFGGRVRASWEEALLPQRLEAAREGALTVLGFESSLGRILGGVSSQPPVFSPNGDGINDRTLIAFQVAQVLGPAPLEVRIYDLAGRPMATLHDREVANDSFLLPWDGRDDSGALVAPGIYLARVHLDGDAETHVELGAVGVAY